MRKDLLNLGALTCIQGSNALVPLVVFPYALSALGSTGYAELVQSEAIAQFILAIVVFSFDVTGVSQLVSLREIGADAKVNAHFSTILYIRLALFLVSSVVAIGLWSAAGRPWIVMALWCLVPLSYIFQSIWLFQGMEHNMPAAAFAMISRVLCVVLVFVLVKEAADKYLIPAAMGISYLTGALGSFCYALIFRKMRLVKVPLTDLLRAFIDGKEIFLGNVSVALYRDLNVLILGLAGVAAPQVAAYSIAEKLTKSLQAVARPLNQLFFPKVIRRIRTAVGPNRHVAGIIMRQTVPQLAGLALVTIALVAGYVMAKEYVPALSRFPNLQLIIVYLGIMVFSVFFGVMNYMFGTVGLNQLNSKKFVFGAIVFVGAVSAATCYVLGHQIGALAAVVCFTGAELSLMLIVLSKYLDGPARFARLARAIAGR